MEHTGHSIDYVSALRRRRWWLIVPIVAALVIGVAMLQYLPKTYRAEATLGVSAPAVSPTIVNQAAMLDTTERVRALSTQLLSDPVLERVVAEEGLGTGDAAAPYVNKLRADVAINVAQPVTTRDNASRLDAFRISYEDSDPSLAQRLTNRLAAVFIEENSQLRTNSVERSSAYLGEERDRAYARLNELESRLRQAKESYLGSLPEQTQANLQALTGLRQQLEINATSLRHQQERLLMVRRQIEALEQDAAKGLAVVSGASAVPDRVATLERELAEARGMYTDKHPEVQRLDAELKAALQEAVAPQPRPTVVDGKARLQVDPFYRQLLADRDSTTLAVRELEHAAATMRSQIAEYQRRVEAAPMVEQQLASVQREYDLAQRHYADLSARVANASMTENVARNRDGEKFSLIYPASLPNEPVSPIPSRVMLIALMVGICLGGALALGREYLDPSIHSTRDLADELDVPVLGEVAHIPAATR